MRSRWATVAFPRSPRELRWFSCRLALLRPVVLCVAALLCLGASAEVAGQRIALVVGNAAYADDLALRNPVNDARLMATTLRELDFSVTLVTDADEERLEDAIEAFGERLRGAGGGGVALFYYAGHGVQSEGVNYLVPVGARVSREGQLRSRTVPAQWVLEEMEEARTALNIVVLDACRNNPFAVAGRSVGGSRGLTRMDAPAGSFFLAYSAGPGQVAEDGEGANSVYTGALAAAMRRPGLQLEDVFKEAGREVGDRTGGAQVPWREGSWNGRFHFAPPASPPAAGSSGLAVAAPDPEAEMWLQIRETTDAGQLERYLGSYPNGRYRLPAEARLETLRGQPFTVLVEPSEGRVRILNIGPRYRAGMRLPAGQYRVEASAQGFETRTETVTHGSVPTEHRIALREAGPLAGEKFRDCPECPEMAVLPAGSYRMGSPSYEQGRQDDEGPVYEVTIGASFAIGVYEVTVAEFGRFVDETGYSAGSSCYVYEGTWVSRDGRNWRNPGFGQSGGHPVACVSWNDAQAYAAWLSRRTGEAYRLPSESEWEYAARAGTATSRYWGEGESGQCGHANGADASLKERHSDRQWTTASCRDGHAHTAPAGSFTANGWGLQDMLGNVWEWTEDCWNDSYAGRRRTAARGRTGIARSAFCAAVRGSSVHRSSAPRFGTRSPPATATTASGFVWPGRSPHES